MEQLALTDEERDAVYKAMDYAQELHRRGILDQAEKLYAGVLKLAPNHAQALNFLGVLKQQQGHVDEALELMAAAFEINSSWTQLLVNYAYVLNQAGRYGAALEVSDRALVIDPTCSDAEFQRGNALMGLDRVPEALAAFDAAIALNPDNLHALINRGNALHKLKRFDDAVDAFARTVAIEPAHPGILNNYGQALNAAGRSLEALQYFERSLALSPDYYQATINQAQALLDLGRYADAIAAADRALALQPRHITALTIRGHALAASGEAEQALRALEAVVTIEPDMASAYYNRGHAQVALNQFAAARASFQIATEIEPEYKDALVNEALTHLAVGDYPEGFRKLQVRLRDERGFAAPLWMGTEPLEGRTLLIYAEQSLSDTLQFIRYAPLAAARGATVVAQVQAALLPLVAGMPALSAVAAPDQPLPAHDLRCPMLSLPLAFRTTVATVPHEVPYVAAPAQRVAEWQQRLPASGRPRIGLVWAGNRQQRDDRNRSLALSRLSPLFDHAGIDWIGLQTELTDTDRAALVAYPQVHNVGEALRDFADTAAVMATLDLVISVDAAAAHLAGAMAKPVWIMLPFSPDWRWMTGRADSPWYPTARLFRQPAINDWNSVVTAIASELPRA